MFNETKIINIENKDPKAIHTVRNQLREETFKYYQSFIDIETGLFADKHTEKRNCPVCDKDEYINIFQISGGQYVKCTNCTMVYTNPVFTEESLEDFYKKRNTSQSETVGSESSFYRGIYTFGLSDIHCIDCQKRHNGCGYDLHFCKKCWEN